MPQDFMPHGYCFLWDPLVLWLHVLSDAFIVFSYYCIPIALVYLASKRPDLPFNWIFWMFGLFIVGCGTTHLLDIWTIWHASYLLAGVVKAITAAVSVATAVMLIPLIPKAIALPSAEQLRAVNHELRLQAVEREQAEEKLKETLAMREQTLAELAARTVQLETANDEMAAFSYSISHDLRAPIRHIGGFSKILEEEFSATLPPEGQRYLQRILEGTQTMGELVDGLLGLARVGRQSLSLQMTDLRPVVSEVVSQLRAEVQGREVEWRIGELPWVKCDPILVRQVFRNLISNALKYSRSRPAALIEIGQSDSNGQLLIFVRDNGLGFSMKYANKLFGAFQRLHRAEDFEGTGMGLATVQRIVHKHGGRIWAEAEPDKGATFYFTLAGLEQAEPQVATAKELGHEIS
jgi:signal transduction histidine kinase